VVDDANVGRVPIVTLLKIAALAIFSPKSTRATLQLANPVSLISIHRGHDWLPYRRGRVSDSSRLQRLWGQSGHVLTHFPPAGPGDSVTAKSSRSP